jgi:hypothetical protein
MPSAGLPPSPGLAVLHQASRPGKARPGVVNVIKQGSYEAGLTEDMLKSDGRFPDLRRRA